MRPMDLTAFHAWWTVTLLVLFIGIVAWAWSAGRKADFDAAARMPLDDEQWVPPEDKRGG